jgi:hypothetical protein
MNDMSIIEIGHRLDNLNCHCDIVMDQGMAEVNWSKFEGAIHDAIEAVNYIDEHASVAMSAVVITNNALASILMNEAAWKELSPVERDLIRASYRAMQSIPFLKEEKQGVSL